MKSCAHPYRIALALIAVCISCKPAPQQSAKPAAGPQVRATVVAIRTTIEKRTLDSAVVIAGDRARSTDEHDTWRLYDTKANTVTFVDDVAKTVRTERLETLAANRSRANAAAIPLQLPRVRFARTNNTKLLHTAIVREAIIESGNYRRELWLGEHPAIPRGLFAMMHVSDEPSSQLAPMMSAVDQALAAERGFPLVDRAMLGDKLIVERTVTAIAQRDVPEALVTLPKDYKDVTPVARNPQR